MSEPSGPAGGHFRKLPRGGGRVAVRFAVLELDGGHGQTGPRRVGYTRNIGEGGAFVETATPEPAGTRLSLELVVPPEGPTITLVAEVRWSTPGDQRTPPGMGLHFQELEGPRRAALGRYLSSLIDTIDHDEAQ